MYNQWVLAVPSSDSVLITSLDPETNRDESDTEKC